LSWEMPSSMIGQGAADRALLGLAAGLAGLPVT
jgi:hypothetical protein